MDPDFEAWSAAIEQKGVSVWVSHEFVLDCLSWIYTRIGKTDPDQDPAPTTPIPKFI
jgi:hypothetical protein